MPAKSKSPTRKKRKPSSAGAWKKTLIALVVVLALSFAAAAAFFYQKAFRTNTLSEALIDDPFVYIRNADNFEDVIAQLRSRQLLRDVESFRWLAEFLEYDKQVRPGRYRLNKGMSNKDLILLLRSGKQEPLRITYKSIRTLEEFCGKTGALLEADSASLMEAFTDVAFVDKYGLNRRNALSLIMPDTYEFYWNTTASSFVEKMGKYYLEFWNEERTALAATLGLTRAEVAVLSSIVQQESSKPDEWPVIAGVYLNRYRKGMKLQADPTVVFANNDFSIRRVRSKHLSVDSPYNTYKYAGFPPGPIYLPTKACMDAVLRADSHSYFYFCARPDGSGYHDFAKSFEEHLRNARNYQKRLNERGI